MGRTCNPGICVSEFMFIAAAQAISITSGVFSSEIPIENASSDVCFLK